MWYILQHCSSIRVNLVAPKKRLVKGRSRRFALTSQDPMSGPR